MASEILLVNPRRRRGGKRRRKMSALQRKYFGGGGGKRRRKRRAAARGTPRRRRRASRRRNPIVNLSPVRRRKRRKGSRARRRSHDRRRRNPSLRGMASSFKPRALQATLMNAVPGAVGALGLDVAMGFLPIPATWKAGYLGWITKAAAAIVIGMVAQNFVKPSTAAKMTEGALSVMFYGIFRNMTAQFLPSVPLGMYMAPRVGMGYYGSGWNPDAESNMSGYLPDISSDSMSTDERDLGMYMETGEYGYGS